MMQNDRSTQAQAQVEHLNRVLRAIRSVNQLIVREKDRGRLIQRACELLVETRGFYGAWILLTDELPAWAMAAQAGFSEAAFAALMQRFERGELPPCGRRIQAAGATALIENTPGDCVECPLAQAYAGAAALVACLAHEGPVYGWLGVSISAPFAADPEERALLGEIAGDLAFALHSIKLDEQQRRSEHELALRNRIANLFLTIPDEGMYAEVLQIILEATASKYGVFGYIDENGDLVVPSMTRHIWDQCQVPDKNIVFPRETWGESIWPRAIRQKKTLYSNERSTLVPKGHVPILRNISVPILHQGEAIGLLQVANKETDYDQEDIQLLETIGSAIAPVLNARLQRDREERERKRAEEEIRRLNAGLEQRVAERTAELQRRNRELSVLYTVSRAAAESLELEKTLNNAVEATREALEIEIGGIYLLEPDGETLTLRVARGVSDETAIALRQVKFGEGMSGRAVAEKKPLVLEVQDYPSARLAPHVLREGIQSSVSMPLLAAGQAVGAMNLSARRPRAFPPQELELLMAIGQQLGNAVRNAQLYGALQQRTAQLEAVNKELEAFAHSVSHDLRAPLRGIDGWSLALLEDCYAQLDEQARQYLDRVRAETQRMGRLIDDLLQLSHVTRAEMQSSLVDLTTLAQTVVARLRAAQPERQVEVVIQPGLAAHGDARLLEIALTNLLGNAWKFTGPRPLARLEFGRLPHPHPPTPSPSPNVGRGGRGGEAGVEGEGPVYFVRDNGVGFDMAYARKLFGAFQRLHRASEFPGDGIGLATVQRIIHRHGGRAWAEAQVDRGATFYFTLTDPKGLVDL